MKSLKAAIQHLEKYPASVDSSDIRSLEKRIVQYTPLHSVSVLAAII